jgi:hypothetical protein
MVSSTNAACAHLLDRAQRDGIERIGTDFERPVGRESALQGGNMAAGRARDHARSMREMPLS